MCFFLGGGTSRKTVPHTHIDRAARWGQWCQALVSCVETPVFLTELSASALNALKDHFGGSFFLRRCGFLLVVEKNNTFLTYW